MPRKQLGRGKPRKRKRKDSWDEDDDDDGNTSSSHSDSTTNKNNQLQPLSARRVLIPNSTPIDGLRRSLRLSTRFIENGTTSLEAEGIPLEQEPLQVEIQPSNKFDEITVKNNRKCISSTGCSSPSVGLKFTEIVGMLGEEDDDDDADSKIPILPEDMVNGYHVKPEFTPILKKIISKHGDIAKHCTTKSVVFRSALLEMICGIISELDKKDVTGIKGKDLKNKISLVDEIKSMEVEVEWLHTRLTEILEARQILKQSGKLKEKLDVKKGSIEVAESALKECETAKKKLKAICDREALWKERLSRSQDECTKTYQEIKSAKSRVKRFLNCSLVDDLL